MVHPVLVLKELIKNLSDRKNISCLLKQFLGGVSCLSALRLRGCFILMSRNKEQCAIFQNLI